MNIRRNAVLLLALGALLVAPAVTTTSGASERAEAIQPAQADTVQADTVQADAVQPQFRVLNEAAGAPRSGLIDELVSRSERSGGSLEDAARAWVKENIENREYLSDRTMFYTSIAR